MSIEHDQSTRKQMRAGITGENVLRPLDEFSVTKIEFEQPHEPPQFPTIDYCHPLFGRGSVMR